MNRAFSQRFLSPVAVLVCVVFAAQQSPAQAAAKTFSREAMLRDIASGVIAPGYENLAVHCRELTNAVGQFIQATNAASLDTARKAWLAAAEAASRMRCFQAGPIADRDAAPTFYYWAALGNSIEGTLADVSRAIDQSLVEEAGATTKGLYALEYLLFDRKGGQATEPAESARALDLLCASPRRREYLLAVARDVEIKAGQVAKDWTASGAQSATAKFVSGGQASVNLLMNQLCQSIENTGEKHLSFALVLPQPISRQLFRIERSRSGGSLQGVLGTLEGMQKFYRGGGGLGLDDAVRNLNPTLAQRTREQLDAAIAATRAIGAPIEQAAVNNRAAIQNAYDKTHALEILFKVDLASALGVTITFTSGDGD
jgi:predicted lipoprotein